MPAVEPDSHAIDTGPGFPEQRQRQLVAPELDSDFREYPVSLILDFGKRLFSQQLVSGNPAARLR